MIYGYARVSTIGQSLDAQLEMLGEQGCTKIYREKFTGTTRNRPQLDKMLKRIDEGDILVVTRIDRIARSTLDYLNIVKQLKEKNAELRCLSNPELSTDGEDTAHRKAARALAAVFAELEKDLIHERTSEGRARAKARGQIFGRPHKLTPYQQKDARDMLDSGSGVNEVARHFNVSHSTISRLKKKVGQTCINS